MFKKALYITALSTLAFFVGGCGLVGQWQSTSFDPEIGRQEFRFLGPVAMNNDFSTAEFSLHRGKTYDAEVQYEDYIQVSAGHWETSGNVLTFVPNMGSAQTYSYQLLEGNQKLILTRNVQGTDVSVTFMRR